MSGDEPVSSKQLTRGIGWHRAASMRRWPASDLAGFCAALGLMLIAALLLRLLAIRHLLRHLGTPIGAVACTPLVTPRQLGRARLIRRSIRRASRVSPLRANCLPQVLVGAVLCRWLNVPAAAHLGVAPATAGAIAAHAWLCAGPIAVTGGDGCRDFVPIVCFLQLRS